jgi:hypothetical protein
LRKFGDLYEVWPVIDKAAIPRQLQRNIVWLRRRGN